MRDEQEYRFHREHDDSYDHESALSGPLLTDVLAAAQPVV
jgi:hypothetical protein